MTQRCRHGGRPCPRIFQAAPGVAPSRQRHARPTPRGFRYAAGLLVERVRRLRRGSTVEPIVAWVEPRLDAMARKRAVARAYGIEHLIASAPDCPRCSYATEAHEADGSCPTEAAAVQVWGRS